MDILWGGQDKHISPEQMHAVVEALRAQGKDFASVEFSVADHGFFCDARASYHARSAAQAWALTLSFLAQHTAARRQEAAS